MAVPVSLRQEVLVLLFAMVISNILEFFLMKEYGLRARLLAILFVDHIYVIVSWAFNINYTLFYVYFLRIDRIVDVSADLVLNFLFIMSELGFIVLPFLFPELSEVESEIFRRNVRRDGSQRQG